MYDSSEEIKKNCYRCKLDKPISDYHKDKNRADGLQYICKPCRSNYVKKYYDHNREKFWRLDRTRRLKHTHNVTVEEFNKKLEEQNGVCAICLQAETLLDPQKKKVRALSIDHDHKTGLIRALLCCHCNAGLGRFKDDINLLKEAIKYLEKYQ